MKRGKHAKPTRGEQRASVSRMASWRMTCSSGKKSYRNERVARAAVASLTLPTCDRASAFVYKCPECRYWHASSKRYRGSVPIAASGR